MSEPKSTKLTIRDNRATALSSTAHSSNANAIGFNIDFLALRNPKLAIKLIKLYGEAHSVQESDPNAPDEDYALFSDVLAELTAGSQDDL